jgi:hypothetical protein
MKKITTLAIAVTMTAAVSLPVFAAVDETGNGAPSGAHYNLNIIGVGKGDNRPKMTGTSGHTIFVPLKSAKTDIYSTNNNVAIVDSKIWLIPGSEFKVCDRNGFDLAYACNGVELGEWNTWANNAEGELVPVVSPKAGAVFQLPCNTNLNGETYVDPDGVEHPLEALIDCHNAITIDGIVVDTGDEGIVPTANYQVWARALGKPGPGVKATITTCATVQGELQCSLENAVLTRTKGGQAVFTDVTNELTSLVVNYCFAGFDEFGVCLDTELVTRIALFAGDTKDWFWNYDNNGLRLAQLRFYDVPVAE